MRKMHDASLCFLSFSYPRQLAKQKSSGVDQGSGLLSQRTETFPIRANTAHSGSIPRLSGAGEEKKKKKEKKEKIRSNFPPHEPSYRYVFLFYNFFFLL